MENDEFYTIEEIATKLKVTRQTVQNWIREGRLHSIKVGRARRIPAEAFRRFLQMSSSEYTRREPKQSDIDEGIVVPSLAASVGTFNQDWAAY